MVDDVPSRQAIVAGGQVDDVAPGDPLRLWAPWRMGYVGGGVAESGCLFCNRLAAGDDVRSLILYRGEHAFVMMNLFPYNTGHVMIAPTQHVPSPEEASDATLAAMTALLRPLLRALRRVLRADGFNIGLNVGAVAGAGVAAHLHQHVVPRWQGDANFMPILASTMVLPELIPVTYAKLRAELQRELSGAGEKATEVTLVVLSNDRSRVLLTRTAGKVGLLAAVAGPEEPIWRAAAQALVSLDVPADLIGWAGTARADATGPVALTFALPAPFSRRAGQRLADLQAAVTTLGTAEDRDAVRHALANLAPEAI
jgi:ATP adenylyltransferase